MGPGGFKVVAQLPAAARPVTWRNATPGSWSRWPARGATSTECAATTEEDFLAVAQDADAIITSWGFPLTRRIIDGLERCVVIGVGSVGVDTVDVDAATAAGIVVTNTPDIFIEEVADHTLALILACARRRRRAAPHGHRRAAGSRAGPSCPSCPACGGGPWASSPSATWPGPRPGGRRPSGVHLAAYDPFVSELRMTGDGVEPVASLASCSSGPTSCRCTPRSTGTPTT